MLLSTLMILSQLGPREKSLTPFEADFLKYTKCFGNMKDYCHGTSVYNSNFEEFDLTQSNSRSQR